MTEESTNQDKKGKAGVEKKHVCTMCGRPSESAICSACSDRLRGEALEKKHDIDKAGRTK